MRAPAADLNAGAVAAAVTSGWGLAVSGMRYVPLGGGSHHWAAAAADGTRYFITVDDLRDKPWLGTDPDSAFAGLRAAFGTALALREQAGLSFVLAPLLSAHGAAVHRLGTRYSVAVFPFVTGHTGRWGDELNPADRDEVLGLLARLHGATTPVRELAAPRGAEVYERAALDGALRDVGKPWGDGPFAEPARRMLSARLAVVAGWLDEFDRLAEHVAASSKDLVVTHGEPHGGNVMRVGRELLLIDWDTVALAPPERDLWMLDNGAAGGLAAYTDATGRAADTMALRYYRLAWRLADLAGFTRVLRSAHQRDGNTEHAWASLQIVLGPRTTAQAGPYRHWPGSAH